MKNIRLGLCILGIAIQVNSADANTEAVVISVARINNLDSVLTESELNAFRTRLEIDIQQKKDFLKLIYPEYDDILIKPLLRGGRYITEKDLSALGQWKNEDYITVIDLSKTTQAFATSYRGTMRVFHVRTREFIVTLDESDKNIEAVATSLAEGLFNRICQGILIITSDKVPFLLTIDDYQKEVLSKQHQVFLIQGRHNLEVKKAGFRGHSKTVEIEPGDKIEWNLSFLIRSAELMLEGSPLGAKVVLEGRGEKYDGKLPYHRKLPEGTYTLNISKPGYEPIKKYEIVIQDGEDIYLDFSLVDKYWSIMKTRSFMFSGLGQYYYGDRLKGITLASLQVAGILAGAVGTYFYIKEKNVRDKLGNEYLDNNVNLENLHKQIRTKEDWMRLYQGSAIVSFVSAAAVYSFNIFDIYRYRKDQSNKRGERTKRNAEEAFDELDKEVNNLDE